MSVAESEDLIGKEGVAACEDLAAADLSMPATRRRSSGWLRRLLSLSLAVFTALTVVFAHHFWDMSGADFANNLTQALKNLSMIGGLLLVVAVGSNPGCVVMDRR